MGDQERVCCMCGDIGFADKLFRCSRCRFRFQHLYCSNYYYGSQELLSPSSSWSSSSLTKSMEVCDWCQSEGRNSSKSFKRSSSMDNNRRNSSNTNNNNNNNFHHIRSGEYTSSTSERIKQDHQTNNSSSGERVTPKNTTTTTNNSGVPSPRQSTHRRYKLLKDVMC